MLLDESLQSIENEAQALGHNRTPYVEASMRHVYVVRSTTFDDTKTCTP
jgi:hypothetical protein